MAEEQYLFGLKEVVEALLVKQDIHEGIWGLSVEFGLGAINMKTEPDGKTLIPTALAGVQKIGIRRYDEESSLTVNAAEFHLKSSSKASITSKRKKSK